MEKIIIIKYGELTLKKKNKNFFIKTLQNNVNYALKDIEHETYYDFGRMFILNTKDKIEEAVEALKNVFGIYEIIIGYKMTDRNIDDINKNILDLIKDKDFKTFKVITKRSDKTYPINSMDVNRLVASNILKNRDLKVDVHKPELAINIEIRKSEVLTFFDAYKGLGGYPVGTLGKGLLMLSGGIDSPVAGFLTIKKGVKIEAIYFDSPPHTSIKAKNKVLTLAQKLAKYNHSIKVHVINFTKIQEAILKNIPEEYLITIMRRMMYRISAIVASRQKCQVLVNGESIGQVASQTLTSMSAINEVVKMPVIRPLACFDKLEVIDLARKIDTYETSILPFIDCCTIFVPPHPVINPVKAKCEEYEKRINYADLIYEAIKEKEVIVVDSTTNNDNYKYSDIL